MMYEFPSEFNQGFCQNLSKRNQEAVLAKCRQNIYDNIVENANNSINKTTCTFSEELSAEHRTTLCEELLERFKDVEITFNIRDKNTGQPFKEYFSDIPTLTEFMSEYKYINITVNALTVDII